MSGPAFDLEAARGYIGKTFLLGLSFADGTGAVTEKRQFYGKAVRVTPTEGVVVKLDGSDEEYSLPKDVKIFKAPPGDYMLFSSGEVITDPDFMAAWTVHPTP